MTRAAAPLSFALLLPLLLAAQPVATDSYLPALPAIASALGSASSSLTMFVLAFGIAQIPVGSLADRIGRRPVLLGGLALYVVAALVGAMAVSAPMLASVRAVQGAAMAAILVCSRAAVRDLYPAHEGMHVMARGLTGLGFVALIAPVLGAFIVQWAGWRWVLVLMAVYGSVLLAMCWHSFSETRVPRNAEQPVAQGGVREVFASRTFRVWSSVSAASYGGIFCFLLLSPTVYIGYLGLEPAMYGWIPSCASAIYICSTTACRRLLYRWGPLRTLRLGAALSLSGALIQAVGVWQLPGSAWPLIVGHVFFSMGHGIHQPCGQAGAVADLPQLAGRAVSWSGFSMMAVAFCVGQLASRFMDAPYSHGAWPMVVPMLLAASTLMLIAFAWLPRVLAQPQTHKEKT